MGRYDKIKVYNNGVFVQPNRIRVWNNGSWLDLGENNSSNTRSLYVHKDGVKTRYTLNKIVTSYTGYSYRHGGEQILDGNTCFSTNSTKAPNVEFKFTAYIRRVTSGEKNIFSTWGRINKTNHLYIILNEDGSISVNVNCSFVSLDDSVATTDNKITDSEWHKVSVRAPLGSSYMYVSLDDGTEVSASSRRAWQVYADNTLGDEGLHIRSDEFYLKTVDGYGAATSTSDVQANENDSWSKTTWE